MAVRGLVYVNNTRVSLPVVHYLPPPPLVSTGKVKPKIGQKSLLFHVSCPSLHRYILYCKIPYHSKASKQPSIYLSIQGLATVQPHSGLTRRRPHSGDVSKRKERKERRKKRRTLKEGRKEETNDRHIIP